MINNYNFEELKHLVITNLNEKNISYIIEDKKDVAVFWFDKNNAFFCSVDVLRATVNHLDGSAPFNLNEGKEYDLMTINDMVDHIIKIMTNDMFQIETYKMGKLCSTNQYIIVNGEREFCSSYCIKHGYFFLPLVRKKIKTICYKYKTGERYKVD